MVPAAAVDSTLRELAGRFQSAVHGGGRNHEPGRARWIEFRDKFIERAHANCPFPGKRLDVVRVHVEHHALMAGAHQAADHVSTHSSEANHSKLHVERLKAKG